MSDILLFAGAIGFAFMIIFGVIDKIDASFGFAVFLAIVALILLRPYMNEVNSIIDHVLNLTREVWNRIEGIWQ